jgi:hypothetical protein
MSKKKEKIKCPICGVLVVNPNDKRHINNPRHQEALKNRKNKQTSLVPAIESFNSSLSSSKFENSYNMLISLEKRIENLEQKFNNLISPYKRIEIKEFRNQLFKEYNHLNPLNDFSGQKNCTT